MLLGIGIGFVLGILVSAAYVDGLRGVWNIVSAPLWVPALIVTNICAYFSK